VDRARERVIEFLKRKNQESGPGEKGK